MAGWNSETPYVIAEIGVNHNGSASFACELVDMAKRAGASAVKFQTFKASELAARDTPKVAYQLNTTEKEESHYSMLEALELDESGHRFVMDFCRQQDMPFISTPYSVSAVDMLEELGVDEYKVASADIVDIPLLERIAQTGKPVILSLGMASLGEVERALRCFRSYSSEDICLLHCVSNYPCRDESVNLRVMSTLQTAFECPIGLSDHSIGSTAAVAAIALGARVVEKHFTADKNLRGPDHQASSEPQEFAELVKEVNRAKVQLGHGVKSIQTEELGMASISRKSVVFLSDFKAGHVITARDLTMRRPGAGLNWDQGLAAVGSEIIRDVCAGEPLRYRDIKWPD